MRQVILIFTALLLVFAGSSFTHAGELGEHAMHQHAADEFGANEPANIQSELHCGSTALIVELAFQTALQTLPIRFLSVPIVTPAFHTREFDPPPPKLIQA